MHVSCEIRRAVLLTSVRFCWNKFRFRALRTITFIAIVICQQIVIAREPGIFVINHVKSLSTTSVVVVIFSTTIDA